MDNTTERKKPGRPASPPDKLRSGRLWMRTYPDIAAKAARLGTKAVEAIIRAAKEK